MKKNVIDLYIRSKVGHSYMERNDIKCYNSNMATRDGLGITTATEVEPREEDEIMRKNLAAFAGKNGLELVVHDLADIKERRKAIFKNVKNPPVFFHRGMRFERMPQENELSNAPVKGVFHSKPQKMRESSKYLAWMPVKFAFFLGFGFVTLLSIFRLIESRAASYTDIHDTLASYIFILALLPSLSGLLDMVERYFELRLSETRLITYLQRQGITLAY